MPDPTLSPLEQQLLAAKTKVRAEMPDVANAPIENMGGLGQFLISALDKLTRGGATMAATKPNSGGSVGLMPEAMAQESPAEQEDTIAHELTHVRQARSDYGNKSLLEQAAQSLKNRQERQLPYGQQPHELEAFQAQSDRAVRQGREPGATPNFSSPGFREKGDYVLPETVKLLHGDAPGVFQENVRALVAHGYSQADAIKRAQLMLPRK